MGLTLTACTNSETQKLKDSEEMNTTLQLTQEWDKVFPKSDKVDHKKVTFKNRYGIELASNTRNTSRDSSSRARARHRMNTD